MPFEGFAPAFPLEITLTDRGRDELGDVGPGPLPVVALAAESSGQLRYLVFHERLPQPRWVPPVHVAKVMRAR